MRPRANKADAQNPAMTSLFQSWPCWRGVCDLRRWAYKMRLLLIVCFFALRALAADDPLGDWKRHPGVEEEFTNSKCVFVGKVVSSRQVMDKDGFIQGTFLRGAN